MSAVTNISQPELDVFARQIASDHAEVRSRVGNISRQSFVYFAGTMLTAAATYFFKVYLARRLGAEALGLYALGMTLIGFAGLFNSLGLPNAAAKFVAAYSAKGQTSRIGDFLRGSLTLLVGLNVFFVALMLVAGPWVAAHFYHAPKLAAYLWAFAAILFLGVLNMFLGQVMAGYRQVARRTLVTHFIGTPVNIVLAVALISLGFGLSGYLAAQVLSAVLILCMLCWFVRKMTPPEVHSLRLISIRFEREVVTFSAAACGIASLQFLLGQADTIVLGHYLHAREVGIYAIATAMVGLVSLALDSVNQIFSPTIAELHAAGNRALLQQIYSILTKWVLVVTFPLATTVIFFSRELMSIFGPGFQPGAVVVVLGALGQLVNCGVGSVGYLLQMSGHQTVLIRIQAVNAVLLVALNIVLIPRFGIVGAAIASAFSTVLTNLWALAAVRRILDVSPYRQGFLKLVAPALACVSCVVALARFAEWFPRQWQAAGVGLCAAYVVFLGAFLLIGLDDADRRFAESAWARFEKSFRRMAVA